MSDNEALRRQVNLTFALLGADGPVDVEWVVNNVDGYGDKNHKAAATSLSRDVKVLRSQWVPVHYDDGRVWLDKDQYELEPVDLTEAEATVVGLAADLARGADLGAFARSGWTKLASSGATRSFDEPVLTSLSNDITQLDPETLRHLLTGVRTSQRLKFDFESTPGAPLQQRVVDPWGIVPLNNRAYLVGWDRDRDAERVFRVRKISNVRRVASEGFRKQEGSLQDIVEKQLQHALADAAVTVTHGGDELASRGTREGGTIRLTGVDRDWLVRTTASLAGNVVAVEPEDVRADVVALLAHAGGGR